MFRSQGTVLISILPPSGGCREDWMRTTVKWYIANNLKFYQIQISSDTPHKEPATFGEMWSYFSMQNYRLVDYSACYITEINVLFKVWTIHRPQSYSIPNCIHIHFYSFYDTIKVNMHISVRYKWSFLVDIQTDFMAANYVGEIDSDFALFRCSPYYHMQIHFQFPISYNPHSLHLKKKVISNQFSVSLYVFLQRNYHIYLAALFRWTRC